MRKVKYFTIFKPHIDNVRYSIEKLRENDEIDLLFSSLECLGGLILVGGAIRDLAVSAIPRDFDIIVDTEIENLNRTLGNFRCQRNRFGGYKLNIFSYNFDVWCIQDNWAFKHHYIETKVENIKYSSFFNVDSLVLHLKEDYWDVSSFNEAIESNLLDIVLGEEMINNNPNPHINIMRALVFRKEYGFNFSKRLRQYIDNWQKNTDNHVEELKTARNSHFGYTKRLADEDIIEFCSTIDRFIL